MQIIVWGVWLWILVLIAKQDRRTRTIPDRLTACLMAAGLLSALWTPQPGMVQRLAGALAVSVPMFVLNMVRPGAFGGGEVKLMAAGGVMLGAGGIWLAFCLALLPAGGYSLLLLKKGKGKKAVFALGPFLCAGMAAAWMAGLLERLAR